MTLAVGTTIKLELPPCRCGHPAVTTVGPHDGAAFPLLCANCGRPRAQVSISTASTIGKITNMFGAPQTITLRRRQYQPEKTS